MGDRLESWRQVLETSLAEIGNKVAELLPSLAVAVFILITGWVVSRIVSAIVGRSLGKLGFDRAAERLRIGEMMRQAGLRASPSRLVALFLFWILMLTFVVSSLDALSRSGVQAALDRLIVFLPRLVGAAFIFVLGLVLARFVGNIVRSGASAARISQAERLAAAVRAIMVSIVAVVTLEELGVETELLVIVSTTLVATVGLTLGLAFALGARRLVSHILAGHYLRQSLPRGGSVEVGDKRGLVERVGAVDTLVRDGERTWSIPNAVLLEEIVVR